MPLPEPLNLQDVRQARTHIHFINPTLAVNLVLIGLCAASALAYVFWSNSLAVADYRISMLHNDLAQLADVNSAMTAAKSNAEDPAALLKFAQSKGMVEAKSVSYLFDSGSVALQR